MRNALAPFVTCLILAGAAAAQDISVSRVGRLDNHDDFIYWGSNNGIAAYSIATTACNVGNMQVSWRDEIKQAPIIGTNMFRIVDGRIEQIGYSYVKYSFCAFDAAGEKCPNTCQDSGTCDWLGVGCADTYWADLNDGKDGGAKWEIDPTTGKWPAGTPSGPSQGHKTIRGRLQVRESKIANAGEIYIGEAQYLSGHDHLAGNARDNYGWRRLNIPSISQISGSGGTQMGSPAIYAWQAFNNDVLITELALEDEGGAGVHGWYWLGSRAIDQGDGTWRYEYALQNGNSGRAAGSISVRIPCDANLIITEPRFRDVRHHSGSPYSNTNWVFTQGTDRLTWETEDFGTNPNANAVRWGTLYSFGFTANRGPSSGLAEIGVFEPGTPDMLPADVIVPAGDFVNYCAVNPNSTGAPAVLTTSGSPWVDSNNLIFDVSSLPPQTFGYFMMSRTQDFMPLFGGGQGNLCLGAPQIRFAKDVLNSGSGGTVQFAPDLTNLPQGTLIQPGETWNFQYWYRDSNPNLTSNTSEGVSITFCP